MLRLRAIAPLLAAAVLTAAAVATVQRAGCSDPGHYERSADGYVLVGGCIAPGDLVIPDRAPATVPIPSTVAPAKS